MPILNQAVRLGKFSDLVVSSFQAINVIYEYFSKDISILFWGAVCGFCSVSFGADRAALACLCSVNSVCREAYACVELCGMCIV